MFEKQERASLIVYLYYNRDRKKLEHYGDIVYHSKKHRYIQIYLNLEQLEKTAEKLQAEKFVKKVMFSPLKELGCHFVGILQQEETTILEN
ncbi:hypothetical protein STRDD10_01204 [Streptococcus sp. DD10]|uniref:DUF2129 domain-containing protein n=1 Tax=Streptococcus sp. DD10 TaxID=1777878 RepID=UPI00079B3F9E|nr:DUF2129 domain-containing protein [Streptococcus sp. DD10]KXT74046.1 hypothetical protein STRDD10_01204 [Streptococcus sp. DD10]